MNTNTNTNNNKPFCWDFSEDWTKKDWIINLIPFGGAASVAYEIGSACLSTRDQTAKISREFFKSPIKTSLKKLAQCLWVPIVVCGALKMVAMIVKACWNKCFPKKKVLDLKSKEGDKVFCTNTPAIEPPAFIILEIFSYLNLNELGKSSCVSKKWRETLVNSKATNLWKAAIYHDFAFSSKNWAKLDKNIVKGVDFREEMLSLPDDIVQQLRLSHNAFPGENLRKSHVLVIMPKGLTIKKLGELAKKYFPNNGGGYRYIYGPILNELNKPTKKSVWLLHKNDVIDKTRGKSFNDQEIEVMNLAKKSGVPYEIPTTPQTIACILAEYSRSQTRLFNDDPWTYTRCQEKVQGYHVLVGGFALAGLCVFNNYYAYDDIGVAALRKF